MRKHTNILITALLLITLSANAQWVNDNSPTFKRLNSISCADSSMAWIVGDKGTMLYMERGKWNSYSGPTAKDLYCVDMISSNNGWAVGADGAIIHYNGENWENAESPTIHDLYSVSFSGSTKGIAVGENGIILNYNGTKWVLSGNRIKGNLFSSSFYKDDIWIGGGRECENIPIVRLSSSGKGTIKTTRTKATISGISIISPVDGWAVGSPSTIMHFDGKEWTKPEISFSFPSLRAVFFSEKGTGISVGYGGTILMYSGNKWKNEDSGTMINLNGVTAIQNTFYAVGDSGVILSKKTGHDMNIKMTSENTNNNLDIFPNPCDDYLQITIPGGNNYTRCHISVKNRSGQTIFQKELMSADANSLYRLPTGKFSNGFYVIEIVLGEIRYSAKFIVQH